MEHRESSTQSKRKEDLEIKFYYYSKKFCFLLISRNGLPPAGPRNVSVALKLDVLCVYVTARIMH